MENKKGQVGATIEWIVATIVIFFIMMLFLMYVGLFGTIKTITESDKIKVNLGTPNDLVLLEAYYSFLDKKIDYNGENLTVSSLILNKPEVDLDKYQKFKGLMNDFIDKNIMFETLPIEASVGQPKKVWFRIYDFDDSAQLELLTNQNSIIYKEFDIYRGTDSSLVNPCNPFAASKSLFYYILPKENFAKFNKPAKFSGESFENSLDSDNLVNYSKDSKNKKLVLCVEYEENP